jgi:SAM-dependent methyltransferase
VSAARDVRGAGRAAAAAVRARLLRSPVIRRLRCAGLRRLHPLGAGRLRGTPIVRHYWARFLAERRADIRGRCLEIGTTVTVRQYGGSAVERADALDLAAHGPEVTLVGDLSRADHLDGDTYDCFVNQFTMHTIADVESALYHSIRLLRPGGRLLVNFPCLEYYFPRGLDMGTGGTLFVHWWFTPIQVENLLRRAGLAAPDYELVIRGNLFARVAYQMNIPAEELTSRELDHVDPAHPLLVCVRVVKPAGWRAVRPEPRDAWVPAVPPARWSPRTGHYPDGDE